MGGVFRLHVHFVLASADGDELSDAAVGKISEARMIDYEYS
jgi:hypothetical protein